MTVCVATCCSAVRFEELFVRGVRRRLLGVCGPSAGFDQGAAANNAYTRARPEARVHWHVRLRQADDCEGRREWLHDSVFDLPVSIGMLPFVQVKGLYKGMSAPLVGITPIFAVCFWAYDQSKKLVRSVTGMAPSADLSLFQIGVAGGLSAVPTTVSGRNTFVRAPCLTAWGHVGVVHSRQAIMAPGERIKCILQVQGEPVRLDCTPFCHSLDVVCDLRCPDSTIQGAAKKYNGPVDVIKSVIKEEGPLGLFRGSAATLARDGSGSVAYFAVYEGIKRALSGNGQTLSPLAVVCGGGFAGTLHWA
jgi:hypothetical protein